MNILFMIGNGFDLNVGLKTQFMQFLPIYLDIPNDDERIKQFKNDINLDLDTWADFEREIGKYARKYNLKNYNDYFFCLDDFSDQLLEHFKNQVALIKYEEHAQNIIEVFKESINNFKQSLLEESQQIIGDIYSSTSKSAHTYSFITFNYTNVLDECLAILINENKTKPLAQRSIPGGAVTDKIGSIIHIHGTLEKAVIIGVDNPSQIDNAELSENKQFSKRIIKQDINNALRNRKEYLGSGLIEKSNIICIFGMSLGETDTSWWKRLGVWLSSNKSNQLVIFIYERNLKESRPNQMIDVYDNYRNRFFDLAEIADSNREALEQRIHIGLNTRVFKVDLIQSTIVDK